MKKMKTLKKNYEFQNVLKKGNFYIGKQIIIYIKKNSKNENRIGIAISNKICNAVLRNKIKRKIRACYKILENDIIQNYNIVFLWNKKIPVKEINFHIILEDMKKSFKKAGIFK